MRKILAALVLAAALVLGVGLYQARWAEATGYCTSWQWMTNPSWCSYYTVCGPIFRYWDGSQWIWLDYCGRRYY